MKRIFSILTQIFFCVLIFYGRAYAATIQVPSLAYPNIQAGIDAAVNGDTVLVADGTYTGVGNKNLIIEDKSITVQSANGPDNCIIDCQNNGTGFKIIGGVGQNSKVIGFTITNGKYFQGGGIYVYNSSPTISNCIIKNNSTQYTGGDYYGGGIYLKSQNPLLEPIYPIISNCIIVGNKSGRRGGGIYLSQANATITNSIIINNSTGNDFDASGGGIFSDHFSNLTITNCIIRGNSPNQGHTTGSSYSNIEGQTTGKGNIDVNPAFIDAANGNYRLKDFSPCIGSGTKSGSPDTDIAGNIRPNPAGSNPDIGAYENILGQPNDSEQWELILDDGQGTANFTLFEKHDGTITADGNWAHTYQGSDVSGTFTEASVTIAGSAMSITASGTATSPSAPPGYNTSPFTVVITGTALNGQGSGGFTMTFQNPGWIDKFSGSWNGIRTSGSGITAAESKALPWLFLLLKD